MLAPPGRPRPQPLRRHRRATSSRPDGVVLAASDPSLVGDRRAELGDSDVLRGPRLGRRRRRSTTSARSPRTRRSSTTDGDLRRLAVAEQTYPSRLASGSPARRPTSRCTSGSAPLLGIVGTYVVSRVVKRRTRGLAPTRDRRPRRPPRGAAAQHPRGRRRGRHRRPRHDDERRRPAHARGRRRPGRPAGRTTSDSTRTWSTLLAGADGARRRTTPWRSSARRVRGVQPARGVARGTRASAASPRCATAPSWCRCRASSARTCRSPTPCAPRPTSSTTSCTRSPGWSSSASTTRCARSSARSPGAAPRSATSWRPGSPIPPSPPCCIAKDAVADERGVAARARPRVAAAGAARRRLGRPHHRARQPRRQRGRRLRRVRPTRWSRCGSRVDRRAPCTCACATTGPACRTTCATPIFVRGFSTKPDVLGGRGIGLPLVRLICTQRGGRVEVDRADRRGGAEFARRACRVPEGRVGGW